MDVRIGIVQSAKELEVELADDADRDAVIADIEASLGKDAGVLWLTDRKGRRVAVPVAEGRLRRGRGAHRRSAGSVSAPLEAVAASP